MAQLARRVRSSRSGRNGWSALSAPGGRSGQGGRKARPTGAGASAEAAPVVTALTAADLVDEVTMVVAATGRRLLPVTDDGDAMVTAAGARAAVLVTDAEPARCRALRDALEQEGTAVRLLRVSAGNTVGPDEREGAEGVTGLPAVLQLPEQAADLAEAVGRDDHPTVAVHGAVGGAGTSVFAAALAGVAADPDAGKVVTLQVMTEMEKSYGKHQRRLLGNNPSKVHSLQHEKERNLL